MDSEPDDGYSYSTDYPEWIEREARRLRNRRRLILLLDLGLAALASAGLIAFILR